MTISRAFKANAAVVAFATGAGVWLSAGCGEPARPVTTTYCCTSGDPNTAYFSTSADCRTGHRAAAQGDQSTAGLYETCNGKPMGLARPEGVFGKHIEKANSRTAAPASLPSPSLALRPASTCLAECAPDSRSPHCITAGGPPPPYAAALAQLAGAVIKQQTIRIEMALLAQNFRVAAGQMPQRGPVVIEGNRLIASAPAPTVFTAPVPGLNATARIELSPALEATIERPGNNTVIIRPLSASKGGSLRLLNNAAADGAAGGRILAVESDTARLMVRTPGACIGVPLGLNR